jgi:hypothetical protein
MKELYATLVKLSPLIKKEKTTVIVAFAIVLVT